MESPQPSTGWKQVVQGNGIAFNNDPFLFDRSVDPDTASTAQRGGDFRRQKIQEVQRQFEDEGMLTHPVGWVLGEYENRKREVRNFRYENPISPRERQRIEEDAMKRLRTAVTNFHSEDLSDPMVKQLYLRFVTEGELSRKKESLNNEKLLEEVASEPWRQATMRKLQESFRSSLKAIMRRGQGALIATGVWQQRFRVFADGS